jgi:hypothetical protein
MSILLIAILFLLILALVYGIRKADKKIVLFSVIFLLVVIAVVANGIYAIMYTM